MSDRTARFVAMDESCSSNPHARAYWAIKRRPEKNGGWPSRAMFILTSETFGHRETPRAQPPFFPGLHTPFYWFPKWFHRRRFCLIEWATAATEPSKPTEPPQQDFPAYNEEPELKDEEAAYDAALALPPTTAEMGRIPQQRFSLLFGPADEQKEIILFRAQCKIQEVHTTNKRMHRSMWSCLICGRVGLEAEGEALQLQAHQLCPALSSISSAFRLEEVC